MKYNQIQTLYNQITFMQTELDRITALYAVELPTPALIDSRWNIMQELFQLQRQLEKLTVDY